MVSFLLSAALALPLGEWAIFRAVDAVQLPDSEERTLLQLRVGQGLVVRERTVELKGKEDEHAECKEADYFRALRQFPPSALPQFRDGEAEKDRKSVV